MDQFIRGKKKKSPSKKIFFIILKFQILDTFGDGVEQITAEMVDETAEASVLKFAEALDYDPSPEHVWYKHLVKEGIIQKFNVVHDEL